MANLSSSDDDSDDEDPPRPANRRVLRERVVAKDYSNPSPSYYGLSDE